MFLEETFGILESFGFVPGHERRKTFFVVDRKSKK
jgi:hypothetical protein